MTCQEWLKLLVPVVAPLAVGVLAYIDFFRRRRTAERERREEHEYDLVRKRYLDEGLDQLIANVQNALSAFQRNYSLALSLLKQYRDFGATMDRPNPATFLSATLDEMNVRPVHRVRILVQDDVVWDLVQLLSGFMFSAQFDIQHDLAGGINTIIEGKAQLKVPKEEMLKTYRTKLSALNSQSHKYFIFLSFLHHLSTIFERNKFTFESMESFSTRADVSDILGKLHMLRDELQVGKRSEPEN